MQTPFNPVHHHARALFFDIFRLWIQTFVCLILSVARCQADFVEASARGETWLWANVTSENGGLPNDRVCALASGRDVSLWIATPYGVSKYLRGAWAHFPFGDIGLPYDCERVLLSVDPKGDVWIGKFSFTFPSPHGHVARLHDSRWEVLSKEGQIPTENGLLPGIVGFAFPADGTTWVATGADPPDKSHLFRQKEGHWEDLASDALGEITSLTSIKEDVWVGTEKGLLKWGPGARTLFDESNSGLNSSAIKFLAAGANGVLWIKTEIGLTRFENGRWTNDDVAKSGFPQGLLQRLIVGPDGTVWAGLMDDFFFPKSGALARLAPGRDHWDVFSLDKEGINGFPVALEVDRDGSLWMAAHPLSKNPQGLFHVTSRNWEVYTPENSCIPKTDLTNLKRATELGRRRTLKSAGAIIAKQSGVVWIGTSEGLCRLEEGSQTSSKSGLPTNQVSALAYRGDELWVGARGGLARFDGQEWHSIPIPGVRSPGRNARIAIETEFWGLIFDRNGDLWVGLGIDEDFGWVRYTLKNGQWVATTDVQRLGPGCCILCPLLAQKSPPGCQIANPYQVPNLPKAIAVQGANTWIGTAGGLLQIKSDGKLELYQHKNSRLPTDAIRSLVVDSADHLWVGTANGDLVKIDGDKWEIFNSSNSKLPFGILKSLAAGHDRSIWIVTATGGTADIVSHFGPDGWQTFTHQNSPLPDGSINKLFVADDDTLWILGWDDKSNQHIALHYHPTKARPKIQLVGNVEEIKDNKHMFAVVPSDPTHETPSELFQFQWVLSRRSWLGDEAVQKVTTRSPYYEATLKEDGNYSLMVAAIDRYGYMSDNVPFFFKKSSSQPNSPVTWVENTLTWGVVLSAIYMLLLFPLIALYPRSAWVRAAVNSGAFLKFPLVHKIIIDLSWSRRQIFAAYVGSASTKGSARDRSRAYSIERTVTKVNAPNAALTRISSDCAWMADVFREANKAIVVGRSGTGKSVLLSHMWCVAADAFAAGTSPYFPILVDLHTSKVAGDEIIPLILDVLRGTKVELPDDVLKFLLRRGDFILLFDGLNEVSVKSLDAFHNFLNRDGANRIIFGSQTDLLQRSDISLFYLDEVTAEQACNYIADRIGSTNFEWKALPPEARILARNPQDLSLLTDILATLGARNVPTTRAALYREMLSADSAFSVSVSNDRSISAVIYALAFRMLKDRRVVPLNLLPVWINDVLASEGLVTTVSNDELVKLLRSSRLFADETARNDLGKPELSIGFRHELVGKFLASRHLRHLYGMRQTDRREEIITLSGDWRWFEVFCFVIDEIEVDDMNQLLNILIQAGGATRLRVVAYALTTRPFEQLQPDISGAYTAAKLAQDVQETPGSPKELAVTGA